MLQWIFLIGLLALLASAYKIGTGTALGRASATGERLHSLPGYYGAYTVLWAAFPALVLIAIWAILQGGLIEGIIVSELPEKLRVLPENELGLVMNDVRNIAAGAFGTGDDVDPAVKAAAMHLRSLEDMSSWAMLAAALAAAAAGLFLARKRLEPEFRARNQVERIVMWFLMGSSTIAILTTVGIVLSLLFEAWRFFEQIPPLDFLFGLEWSPQTAIRDDQVGSSGAFGAIPVFAGTMLISLLAMMVAAPIGLFAAIYMAEYASPRFRAIVKPVLEILAGIPTVVYGFFAALTMAPFFREMGDLLGFDVASQSALAAGVVMGVMIIPFVSSLSDDVITAVPRSLREGSYGLGATKSETIRKVIIPAALPGIVGSLLLAVSRAIGETMIVVMAAGLSANLTGNPFEAVTTVTVQIVTLLVGDQEFDSAKTLAAFALGLVLFFVTLILNVIALHVVRKYREQYD